MKTPACTFGHPWRRLLIVLPLAMICATTHAQEPMAKVSPHEVSNLLQQFNEISQKVRTEPEIQNLERKAEEAQKAYTLAYEQAIEKEAPQLLDKIRRLQRERLQAIRKQSSQFPSEFSEDAKLSPDDRARLQKVRALAFKEADVIHERVNVASAANQEEREKAEAQYQKVLLDTMRRIDPGIDEVLNKLKQNAGGNPSPTPSPAKKKSASRH